MLNIPHATKPSADIHVIYPHHIGKYYSNTASLYLYQRLMLLLDTVGYWRSVDVTVSTSI